jgi:GNAT superfamily N-acetyltransferase
MNDSIRIRCAQPADAAGIARVHVDTWRTTYGGIVPAEHLANLSYTQREERWRERLTDPNNPTFTYVAETDAGRIVGFATGCPERENDPVYKGELGGLYVLKEYQHRGIGRQLVMTIARHLINLGFTNMLIWVLAENSACGFYAALGGKPVREKMANIGGKDLREIGYGWDDLQVFLHE